MTRAFKMTQGVSVRKEGADRQSATATAGDRTHGKRVLTTEYRYGIFTQETAEDSRCRKA